MKKNILIIAAALALSACGGNGGNKNAENADSSAVGTQTEPQVLFNYVEPQEEIAKIIWEKIQDTYPDIKKAVNTAKKWQMDEELGDYFNGASQKEIYYNKTRMRFYNVIDGAEGSWDALCYYKLQCYQNNDGSWTAVLYNNVTGVSEEANGCNLLSFLYKDGNLTDNTQQTNIPGIQVQPLTAYCNTDYTDCTILYDTIGFNIINRDFWPIRYNWNGEKFITDPNSVVLANIIDEYGKCGPFHLGSEPKFDYSVAKDAKVENNTISQNGEKLVELEISDQALSAVTIYSKKIGFAQKYNYTTDRWGNGSDKVITSKPLAVGYPIKNAFDKEDYAPDYTVENKDGYYVLTRRTYRNKSEKRDIMISFYAKDEKSNIEKIRMFVLPLQITLESEMEDTKEMDNVYKEIWKKLNDQYKITSGLGEFHNVNFSDNGFYLNILDDGKYKRKWADNAIDISVKCFMHKKIDGSYLILTQKNLAIPYWVVDEQQEGLKKEFAQYIYKDGKFTQTKVEIPDTKASDYRASKTDNKLQPVNQSIITSDPSTMISWIPIISDGTSFNIEINENGFEFRANTSKYDYYGEFEDSPAYEGNYLTQYIWDGENFVPRAQYDEKGEAMALDIYSKIPAEDLHFDYKTITKNDIVTEYDFKGKKVSAFAIGFQNYWEQKNKMKMEAIRTGANTYDVFYLTQQSASAPKQFLKYTYNNGVLSKASISQAEIDSLKNKWSHLLKND